MWQKSLLVRYLWAATPALQALVIAAMVRRRLHRDFPWFFRYAAYNAVSNLLNVSLFLAHRLDGTAVAYALFVQELGCIILRFAVIYELFILATRPYPALRNTAHWVFRICMAALILGGVALAASYRWVPTNSLVLGSLNVGDRTVDVIQCGILLLLLVLSNYLHLSWRDYASGIAIGLGVYASVDLSIASILVYTSKLPVDQQRLVAFRVSILSISTYLLCNVMWLVYALLPERVSTVVSTIPEHDLNAWDHELQRLIRR
jgi:hypothetical protein